MCRQNHEHIFHVDYSPPEVAGICDLCGRELYQREDDREATVRKRLEVYRNETASVVDHYQIQGLVTTISVHAKSTKSCTARWNQSGKAGPTPPRTTGSARPNRRFEPVHTEMGTSHLVL